MSMLTPPPSNLSMVCKHYYSHELAIKYLVRQNENIDEGIKVTFLHHSLGV